MERKTIIYEEVDYKSEKIIKVKFIEDLED